MKEVVGGILLAAGVLIAGGSGLCSLMVLFDQQGEFSGFQMWPAVLLFGGIPFTIGVGMVFSGRALLRSARRDRIEAGQIDL
jgi:hypothetical protein